MEKTILSAQKMSILLDLVTIRLARRTDLPALEWNGEFSHFRRLYQDIFLSYEQGEAILWVADLEGNGVVGQVFVQLFSARPELADGKQRAYIYGFRVQASYRRRGLGTRMLAIVETDLVQRGFERTVLNVNRDNLGARRLYERHGYHVVAAEPGHWSYLDEHGRKREVHEPAWRMEKDLLGTTRQIKRT